jgi:hypothetical protein
MYKNMAFKETAEATSPALLMDKWGTGQYLKKKKKRRQGMRETQVRVTTGNPVNGDHSNRMLQHGRLNNYG